VEGGSAIHLFALAFKRCERAFCARERASRRGKGHSGERSRPILLPKKRPSASVTMETSTTANANGGEGREDAHSHHHSHGHSHSHSHQVLESIMAQKMALAAANGPAHGALAFLRARTSSMDSVYSGVSVGSEDGCRCDDCLLGITDWLAEMEAARAKADAERAKGEEKPTRRKVSKSSGYFHNITLWPRVKVIACASCHVICMPSRFLCEALCQEQIRLRKYVMFDEPILRGWQKLVVRTCIFAPSPFRTGRFRKLALFARLFPSPFISNEHAHTRGERPRRSVQYQEKKEGKFCSFIQNLPFSKKGWKSAITKPFHTLVLVVQ